ncbi:uncharacterized [Tachysurus ichikawai]
MELQVTLSSSNEQSIPPKLPKAGSPPPNSPVVLLSIQNPPPPLILHFAAERRECGVSAALFKVTVFTEQLQASTSGSSQASKLASAEAPANALSN